MGTDLATGGRPRKNLLGTRGEHWLPFHYDNRVDWKKPLNKVLRFLDLQAGTIWDDLSRELPKVEGAVLDVGCGLQPYRSLLSPEASYVGIDTVDSKSHFGLEAPGTLYFSGTTWPVKGRSVDFVMATETLEHVQEPLVFLREAHRCLKPGGRLLLTVPFSARWHFVSHDYWRFTPDGLKRLLAQSGFTQVRVFARGNQLTVACYKSMGLILSLLFPVRIPWALAVLSRLLGLLVSPFLLLAAVLANLTKGIDGTVDCLGYTVFASKKAVKKDRRKVDA